jgi:hypothetical protein
MVGQFLCLKSPPTTEFALIVLLRLLNVLHLMRGILDYTC